MKRRVDELLVKRELATSRSAAANIIKLGKVKLDGKIVTKPGLFVDNSADIHIAGQADYVSRAAYKLESVAKSLNLDFRNKVVLDVGSSTGGFTDFALRSGAKKVIAVDVGTDQLHHKLRGNPKIELHEKTDIRDLKTSEEIDLVLIDVSFISLKEILPSIKGLSFKQKGQSFEQSLIVAMAKPQFEAGAKAKHKGVIKNDKMRREILKELELWLKKHFAILNKADSHVAGNKGNKERFYLLKII